LGAGLSTSEGGLWAAGDLDCENANSPPSGTATTLRQPAGRTWGEENARAESAGALGGVVDVRDLDLS
jgi:hypothetical protein